MSKSRKRHSDSFKARVALDALKGVKTLSELSSEYGVHASQICAWKKQVQTHASELFSTGNSRTKSDEELTAPLYEEIGRLQMDVKWLRKKL